MKKLLFILTMLFLLLSLLGAGYVLQSGGGANAGYGVIPLVFSLACLQGYMALKRKRLKNRYSSKRFNNHRKGTSP